MRYLITQSLLLFIVVNVQSRSLHAEWQRFALSSDSLTVELPRRPVEAEEASSRTYYSEIDSYGTIRTSYLVKVIDTDHVQDFQTHKAGHIRLKQEMWKSVSVRRETPIRCGGHPGIDFTLVCSQYRRFGMRIKLREDVRVLQIGRKVVYMVKSAALQNSPLQQYSDAPLHFFDSLRLNTYEEVEPISFQEPNLLSGYWREVDTKAPRNIRFLGDNVKLMIIGQEEGTYIANTKRPHNEIDFAILPKEGFVEFEGGRTNTRSFGYLERHIERQDNVRKGIYKFEAGTLQIALGQINGSRPKDFQDSSAEQFKLVRPGRRLRDQS